MVYSYTLPTEREAIDFVICLKCLGLKAMTGATFNPRHGLIVYSDSKVTAELLTKFGAVKFFDDIENYAGALEYIDDLYHAFKIKKQTEAEVTAESGKW